VRALHVIDIKHYLDASGAIAPVKGPARRMAQFVADVVAHASDTTGEPPAAPKCFKCGKSEVDAAIARDMAIVWTCPRCNVEGRISNWQGTLWDLRDRPPPSA
jgi:ribosomal protein L37AE/L43A